MADELSNRRIKGIKKMLSYDRLKAKAIKKKKQIEKANQQKVDRHRSKQQEIDELLTDAIDSEEDSGGDA